MSNRFPVSVAGRLATDPTLYTSAAAQRATFRLAVDDRQQGPEGHWETRQTVFHDVAAWGRLAEIAVEQLRRGDAVVIAGTLKFDTYEKEGIERTRSEIVAEAIGPDLRLASVTIDRRDRTAATEREAPSGDRVRGAAQADPRSRVADVNGLVRQSDSSGAATVAV